jgi:hypothetical protein
LATAHVQNVYRILKQALEQKRYEEILAPEEKPGTKDNKRDQEQAVEHN